MPSRPAPADRLSRASGLSDAEILGRIRRGDVQLFELLMRRHNQRLYRLVRSIVREDAAAEDAAQEAWVRAFTHLHQFEERSTFSTWLLRIGVHEAYASLRRARRLVPFEGARTTNTGQDAMDEGHVEDVVGRSLAADSPEWLAERAELRRILVRVIDRLPRPIDWCSFCGTWRVCRPLRPRPPSGSASRTSRCASIGLERRFARRSSAPSVPRYLRSSGSTEPGATRWSTP
jgi:RNA polymerase sigma factor (sigma-70 family)